MMFYGSRKWGYDQGGCVRGGWFDLCLWCITLSPSQTLRRRLVWMMDAAVSAWLDACRR